ncbi:class I adenylate-forming enzyme family protein [Halogeometricum limi]|uniref:Fatty-acyl-CoA synthase n=1 Tax=Halogeometricum limi TaxID=555875 RepID=A0A1I6IAC8_9EURY|nr:AMP-binding protein [Halogeometricum limi]SFR63717.1 fatty-acyl-CoA synthase [Halogeometricum limi]
MKLVEAFDRTVRCYPTETALVTEDGRAFSYRELDERSTRLANALERRVGSARCAVLAHNGPPAITAMLAGNERGVATVQLSFRATTGELVEMAETASARALLFDDGNVETALELLDRGTFDAAIHAGDATVEHDDVESYEAVLDAASPDRRDDHPIGDECAVLYTSGTTSTPKAVPFDQEQLWYGAIQGVMEQGIDETDVALCTTPWYHMVTTDAWLYPHFVAGATVVLQRSFDPRGALELVEERDVTGLLAVPTQLRRLNAVQAEEGYDTSSLSYVRTGGSPLTKRLVEETAERLGERIYNTYGMTEGGPNLSYAHPEVQRERPGTIGKEAFSYELRVVEPAPLSENPDPEATVDAGERGEILARGPGMSTGYIDNPEAEAKTYFDGWLRTRDVAEVDEDGFLYVVDRVDNMILSGGENVYPAEVERALESHPDVREACVFGTPDDEWDNVVTAVVVTDADLTADDLSQFCLDHDGLANFKRPREYVVTSDSLPRTETGKIVRGELADRYFPEG